MLTMSTHAEGAINLAFPIVHMHPEGESAGVWQKLVQAPCQPLAS